MEQERSGVTRQGLKRQTWRRMTSVSCSGSNRHNSSPILLVGRIAPALDEVCQREESDLIAALAMN